MYYIITQNLSDFSFVSLLGHTKKSGSHLWVSGKPLTELYSDDTFYVESSMGTDTELPDFFDSVAPLMSQRLFKALNDLGVDNLVSYPVKIKNKGTGETFDNYLAVNVIGLVDAINIGASDIEDEDTFHSTVIDENKTMGMLCFRLFHGPTLLMIRDDIANTLIGMNLKGVLIIKSEDYDEDKY